jgi:HEAT repeat protein
VPPVPPPPNGPRLQSGSAAKSQDKSPAITKEAIGERLAAAKDTSKDSGQRMEAVRALAEMGPTALPALAELVKDKDRWVRLTLVDALNAMRPPAVAPLIELLTDEDWEVQDHAQDALVEIGRPAIPALANFYQENRQTRRIAATTLRGMGGAATPVLAELFRSKDFGFVGYTAPSSAAVLTEFLKDKDWMVRKNAVEVLQNWGPAAKEAVPALLGLLVSPTAQDGQVQPAAVETAAGVISGAAAFDPQIRQVVAADLGRIGPAAPETVPALTQLLKHKSPPVRQAAASILAKFGPAAAAAVPALVELAKSDTETRTTVAETLGAIGPAAENAVPTLAEWAKDANNGDLRKAAIEALGKIVGGKNGPWTKTAVSVLTELLKDKDEQVRLAAAAALAKIGPAAAPAIPALAELTKDGAWGIQRNAAQALGSIGPEAKGTVADLARLLSDKDDSVREAAACALGQIGPDAAPAAAAVAELVKRGGYWHGTPTTAAEALLKIGPASTGALAGLLKCDDELVVEKAAETLGNIGPGAATAMPALEELLKSRNVQIRLAAALAMLKIGPQSKAAAQTVRELLRPGGKRHAGRPAGPWPPRHGGDSGPRGNAHDRRPARDIQRLDGRRPLGRLAGAGEHRAGSRPRADGSAQAQVARSSHRRHQSPGVDWARRPGGHPDAH